MIQNTLSTWYYQNIVLLHQVFNDKIIRFDGNAFSWFLIQDFDLPPIWVPAFSDLLVVMAGLNGGFEIPPYDFYLDRNLRTKNGACLSNYFEEPGESNKLGHLGYAYLCIHLMDWQPSLDVVSGDNLLTVVDLIYQRMSSEM